MNLVLRGRRKHVAPRVLVDDEGRNGGELNDVEDVCGAGVEHKWGDVGPVTD